MKKSYKVILSIFVTMVVLNACKDYSKTKSTLSRNDSLINSASSSTDSAHLKGARLIAANDCITCHSVDQKLFGPSFIQIAAKYSNDEKLADFLANNVIKGSKGIYGENAMTPHPNLKYSDIVEMTRYILSVKAQ